MTLTDFLLARIAEDERDVPHLFDEVEIVGGLFVYLRTRYLAECEAKRAIIGEREDDEPPWIVLRHMAAVYADHPDYRQEWRP